MSKTQLESMRLSGVACLVVAIVLFVLSQFGSRVYAVGILGSAFFFALAIALLLTWLINRRRV
jgi:hypothetical protein